MTDPKPGCTCLAHRTSNGEACERAASSAPTPEGRAPDAWDALPDAITDAICGYRRAIEDEAGAYEWGGTSLSLGQSSCDAREELAKAIRSALSAAEAARDETERAARRRLVRIAWRYRRGFRFLRELMRATPTTPRA